MNGGGYTNRVPGDENNAAVGQSNRIDIREAGVDAELNKELNMIQKENANDKHAEDNKKFFKMPSINRQYPQCNY
jgi:hypothetical protein